MTVEELRTHIGDLIHIKTELFLNSTWRCDGVPERICMLLDVGTWPSQPDPAAATDLRGSDYYLYLLIDGRPMWIGLNKRSFEVIK